MTDFVKIRHNYNTKNLSRLFFAFYAFFKYYCIKRKNGYKDISFVCWCIPDTDNELLLTKLVLDNMSIFYNLL